MLTSTSAFALSSTEFTDYPALQGHWGLNDINVLLSMNGIKGIPNGDGTYRFEADRAVTMAELLSLILNASGNVPSDTEAYPMNVMEKASELGLIEGAWFNEDTANSAISREKMAYIVNNTLENILGEDTENCKYLPLDDEKVPDLYDGDWDYVNSIATLYGTGIAAGAGDAGFMGSASLTRAEACAIINRTFQYTSRLDNTKFMESNVKEVEAGYKHNAFGEGCYGGVITQYPVEGDIVNGVVVTKHPVCGVLGYGNGQKGGIYLGVEIGNTGRVLEVGDMRPSDICDGARGNKNASGYYTKKGDYVYWDKEWNLIAGYVYDTLPTTGLTEGTCADLYGNILEGVNIKGVMVDDMEELYKQNIFFAVDDQLSWSVLF